MNQSLWGINIFLLVRNLFTHSSIPFIPSSFLWLRTSALCCFWWCCLSSRLRNGQVLVMGLSPRATCSLQTVCSKICVFSALQGAGGVSLLIFHLLIFLSWGKNSPVRAEETNELFLRVKWRLWSQTQKSAKIKKAQQVIWAEQIYCCVPPDVQCQ